MTLRRAAMMILLVCGIAAWIAGCSTARRGSTVPTQTKQGQGKWADAPAFNLDSRDILRSPGFWPELSEKPPQHGGVPPQDGAVPSEELWVIARDRAAATNDDVPGTGALLARVAADQKPIPVPLKRTDVRAAIAGYIATVDVTQQFHNPFDSKIEATYVFPLPANAAVSEFVMTIGDRHIRGIVREKAEAQKIYDEAKSQGYVASLLVQDRPNVFTHSVANIEPGKRIDVNIRYFNTLDYSDGSYEFVFPMVVGPRFNPPGFKDGIGAAAVGAAGASGQAKEIQYLKPDQRSGHDIGLSVDIDAGVPIERIDCRNHQIDVKQLSPARSQITLRPTDAIPNRDFVLRYKVAGDRVKAAMMVQRDAKSAANDARGGGYFTLMIFPPDSIARLPRKPLEMVYTLDVSGSMNGQPLAQALAATRWALTHMQPADSFQIVQFDSSASQMSAAPLPATNDNIARGLHYLAHMQGGGGTMMLEGIRRSLDFPHDPQRSRFVTFLTDGYIGNEIEILTELRRSLGPSRVFSFGVGSSTNRYLLDGMARLGNGAAAYLGLNDDAEKVMAEYFERISHPALTDVKLDFGGAAISEVYPRALPDLLVGRPIVISGRFDREPPRTVCITGNAGGEAHSFAVAAGPSDATIEHNGIAGVWARAKIADISHRAIFDQSVTNDAPRQIKEIALEHGLLSAYTSFVAVDSTERTIGDHGSTVAVPVPVPQGVRYDTTVSEK